MHLPRIGLWHPIYATHAMRHSQVEAVVPHLPSSLVRIIPQQHQSNCQPGLELVGAQVTRWILRMVRLLSLSRCRSQTCMEW